MQECAVGRWDFEAHPLDGDGAVALALLARDLGPERASERIGVGALATDAGAAHPPRERSLVDLRVLFALILLFDPCLGRRVEQSERQLGLPLEHGEKAPFDLSPEGFLLSVLLRRIRQRRVMHDPQALEPLNGLGGEHGRAVVGQKRARQAALLECLRQRVDESFGGLVEIPLQVATEAGVVVEDTEELWFLPLARGGKDGGASRGGSPGARGHGHA